MNRKSLLEALRKQGYKGAADPVAVKSFLSESGQDSESIEVPGEDGNPVAVKFDDVWAKTATLALATDPVDDAEADAVEPVTKSRKPKTDDRPAAGSGWKASGLSQTMSEDGGTGNKTFGVRSEREKAVKAYNRKAADSNLPFSQKAVYESGDEAEYVGAFFRLATTGGGRIGYAQKRNDLDIIGKANVDFDNSLGGVAVPVEFSNKLIWLTEKYGVATQLATVQRMSGDQGIYPRVTAIQPMVASAEAATKTQADDTFDGVTLNAREASLIKQASYQWYQDAAINVGDLFSRNFAEAGARRIDLDYISGDGTATYNNHVGLVGKLTGGKKISASGNNWTAWTTNDYNKALGLLEYVDSSRLKILSTRQHFYAVPNRLQTSVSQFVQLVGPGTEGADKSFLSLPFYFGQTLWESGTTAPTLSGAVSAFVGDFAAGSMIGIRDEMRIFMSEHYGFAQGLLSWRGTMRYSVNIHLDGRGATYGPILALANS